MIKKAKWGQNFLKDPKIIKKIVDFAQIKNIKDILEIGPGEGILTQELLGKGFRVLAIEKDGELAEKLELKFKEYVVQNKLQIIKADVLGEDLDSQIKEFGIEDYVLLGNIPYYITGAIFRKVFDLKNLPKSLTFVVQKEVAERIVARDGKESILSIALKAYGEPKIGGIIRAGSFHPKPKVDSAIIKIDKISRKNFEEQEDETKLEQKFFEILKLGFAHKRKLLLQNLLNFREFQPTPSMSRTHLDIKMETKKWPGLGTKEGLEVSRCVLDRLDGLEKGEGRKGEKEKREERGKGEKRREEREERIERQLKMMGIFEKCGIPLKARAENLTVQNWLDLAENL